MSIDAYKVMLILEFSWKIIVLNKLSNCTKILNISDIRIQIKKLINTLKATVEKIKRHAESQQEYKETKIRLTHHKLNRVKNTRFGKCEMKE